MSNDYLSEAKGRSMPGTPGFARPRDIPRERQALLRVRVERQGAAEATRRRAPPPQMILN